MKKLAFLLFLLTMFIKVVAQNSYLDYKYAIKVYNLTSYEKDAAYGFIDSVGPSERNSNSTIQYLHPTLAFQWKTKKQNFNEIELIQFYFNQVSKSREQLDSLGNVESVISKNNLSSSGISLRYEYIVNFDKLKTHKFVASVGFSGNPYFKAEQFIPEKSNAFRSAQSIIGVRGFVIPRISYYMNSRFFLDLNVPLCIMQFEYESDKSENPKIPVNQQQISTFDFELFPQLFSARIGLGFKI